MIIKVTDADIAEGKRCDNWACPVALALWRATGWKWEVDPGEGVLQDYSARPICHGRAIALPRIARRWIHRYDIGPLQSALLGNVLPFEFELSEELLITAMGAGWREKGKISTPQPTAASGEMRCGA